MKKAHKLRVFYSKREKDTIFNYPFGRYTKADAHFLHGVFTKEFQDELEARGYDWKTVRFEISPKLPHEKFPTLSEQYVKNPDQPN